MTLVLKIASFKEKTVIDLDLMMMPGGFQSVSWKHAI